MEPKLEWPFGIAPGFLLFPDSDLIILTEGSGRSEYRDDSGSLSAEAVFHYVDGVCFRNDLLPTDLVLVCREAHRGYVALRRRDR